MNDFLGADTDELRSLASRFATGSQRLQDIREAAEAVVRAATWTGPDADEFRHHALSVLADLNVRASDAADRGRALETEADEQDRASSPRFAIPGVGAGAWQPGTGVVPDAGTRSSDQSGKKDLGEVVNDIILRILDKKVDEAVDILERANGGPSWLRGAKKFLPVIPEAIDLANHAVHGETYEAIFAIGRGGISLTPFGIVEDVSSVVFPHLPNDWMLPGTDVPVNEGSILDGYEKYMVENGPNDTSEVNTSIREGEQYGMEISDRLGIENEYIRNVFKTYGGISAGVGAAHRDPSDGSAWYIGKGLENPWG